MPVSDKKLAANRANSLKSTGPKNSTGSRISSGNATKHALLAKVVLIDGECPQAFADLIKSLHREYRPVTPTEHALVETMVVAQWRLLRAWTVEAAAISHEMQRRAANPVHEDAEHSNAIRAMLAMRSLGGNSGNSEILSRYEHRFDTQFHRALRELRRLRERKPAVPNEATESEQNKQPVTESTPVESH